MISLTKAYNLFIESRKLYCAKSTLWNYSNTLRYFINFMEDYKKISPDEMDIDTIEKQDLNEYIMFLRNKKKNDNHNITPTESKGVTKRTIKTYSVDMRTFFNFLYSEEYIENNPVARLKIIKPEKKAIIPINDDEMRIIDDTFNINTAYGCRNLAIVHCLLDEGMRTGEVCNLKIDDINFSDDYLVIHDGKGSKDRILPLSRLTRKYVERYLKTYRAETTHKYIFCNIYGDPLTQDAIKGLFCRIKEKTNIKRLYPHLLRHTFATSFLCGGGSIEMLRIYMGHSDIKTTQNYLHMVNAIQFCKNIYHLDSVFFKKLY